MWKLPANVRPIVVRRHLQFLPHFVFDLLEQTLAVFRGGVG